MAKASRHPLQKCKQDNILVFFCGWAVRTVADASNYATERRTAASVRTHGREPTGQTTNRARNDFQQRFDQEDISAMGAWPLFATDNIILAPNCSKWTELYLHPQHAFTVCTRTMTPPPRAFSNSPVSKAFKMPKCAAQMYCRSPFRNTAICQASSTRSVSVPPSAQ